MRSPDGYVKQLVTERAPELGVLVHRWRHPDLLRRAEPQSGTPLALVNPGLPEPARTTRTLTCAITHLEPGARPRAGPPLTGIRVLLEGEAHFTPSSGSTLTVGRGDLLRIEDGDWRAGDPGALWLDALDLPLVSAVGAAEHERARCPRRRTPCLTGERLACRPLPRVHRWAQTEAVLAGGGEYPRMARFGTPASGGDLTPTLRAEVHRLDGGRRTESVRASHSAVVTVLAGSGTSVVGGWRLRWETGDVFVVPSGAPVDHHPDVTADVLVVSDAPALAALGLWWSEAEPEHQPIEDTLD